MSEASLAQTGEGQIAVTGGLTFAGARDLMKQGLQLIKSAGTALDIDLAGVTRFDSAAVALLLEWRKQALAADVKLTYRNIPEGLLAIARISEVEQMLEASN